MIAHQCLTVVLRSEVFTTSFLFFLTAVVDFRNKPPYLKLRCFFLQNVSIFEDSSVQIFLKLMEHENCLETLLFQMISYCQCFKDIQAQISRLKAATLEHLAALRVEFRCFGSMDVYCMSRFIVQSAVKCVKHLIRNDEEI